MWVIRAWNYETLVESWEGILAIWSRQSRSCELSAGCFSNDLKRVVPHWVGIIKVG